MRHYLTNLLTNINGKNKQFTVFKHLVFSHYLYQFDLKQTEQFVIDQILQLPICGPIHKSFFLHILGMGQTYQSVSPRQAFPAWRGRPWAPTIKHDGFTIYGKWTDFVESQCLFYCQSRTNQLGKSHQFSTESMHYKSVVLLYQRLQALPENIALGWKALPGRNTIAYFVQT